MGGMLPRWGYSGCWGRRPSSPPEPRIVGLLVGGLGSAIKLHAFSRSGFCPPSHGFKHVGEERDLGNACVKHLAIHNSLGASGHYQSACQSTDPLSLVDKEATPNPYFQRSFFYLFFRDFGLATSEERKELLRGGGVRFIYVCIRKRVTVKTQNTINRIYTKKNIGFLERKKSRRFKGFDFILLFLFFYEKDRSFILFRKDSPNHTTI